MKVQNRILRITSPKSCQQIGMSICPGKIDAFAFSGSCRRNLDEDLQVIKSWGANHVISLLEKDELEYLQVQNLGQHVKDLGMEWQLWEVIDGSALRLRSFATHDPWKNACAELLEALSQGEKIFIHCRGGLGRTGTLASRLLIEMGLEPEAAIAEVREARPGAIETAEQEQYLLKREWK